jgi:hypothetical protein
MQCLAQAVAEKSCGQDFQGQGHCGKVKGQSATKCDISTPPHCQACKFLLNGASEAFISIGRFGRILFFVFEQILMPPRAVRVTEAAGRKGKGSPLKPAAGDSYSLVLLFWSVLREALLSAFPELAFLPDPRLLRFPRRVRPQPPRLPPLPERWLEPVLALPVAAACCCFTCGAGQDA